MSFFVTRPPRPVPCDLARVDAVLGRDARDDGRDEVVLGRSPAAAAACAPAGCGRSGSGGAGSGAARPRAVADALARRGLASSAASCVAGAGGASRRAPTRPRLRGAITASTVPTSTVSPSWHEDLRDDALAGARHLGVDLVGRDLEQRLVGARSVSPSFFSHFVTVPSETETPICGMTTSICVFVAMASS